MFTGPNFFLIASPIRTALIMATPDTAYQLEIRLGKVVTPNALPDATAI